MTPTTSHPVSFLRRFEPLLRVIGVVFVVIVAGGSAAWLAASTTKPSTTPVAEPKTQAEAPTKLRRVGADSVVVPASVQAALGVKTAAVTVSTRKRKLPAFQGTLNFDNNHLARVQSPFSGPIIELATVPEAVTSALPESKTVRPRPIRVGDPVHKGDVLAVVWSKDLGEKKSELVAALAQLKTDQETYKRLEDLLKDGGTAERSVREAEKVVKADRVAVERAEATLRSWRLTSEDIAPLYTEAEQLTKPDAKRADPAKWARVEIKAPLDGVILEQNVTEIGRVVDPSLDLFRIGDLSTLAVWVHLYVEDLPLLKGVALPTACTVTVPSDPGATYSGRMQTINASIDPNQHTALATGVVENRNGQLRAGMTVAVTVELPPATGELEVPAEAVIEDGRESSVFVRVAPGEPTFRQQRVRVVRRGRDVISVALEPTGLKAGDTVVTAGSLLLNDAVSDLPAPKS